MSKVIWIAGEKYPVVDRLGWNHDVGAYVVEVERPDGTKAMAVRYAGVYRFWTPRDRVLAGRGSMVVGQ